MPTVRAVLFDLDDTLFDHQHCSRTALEGVHRGHEAFRRMAFVEFEQAHGALLEELHHDVMLGRVPVDDARIERFRRLFLRAGMTPGDDLVRETAVRYRQCYVDARRAVAGAAALVARVRERAAVVVVSNNIRSEQQEKLEQCGLVSFIDALVVSEDIGVSKPDPMIFTAALERVGCGPEEAVMVGDSWAADIRGARAAGIRAIWFNQYAAARPEPAEDVVEVRSLEPPDAVIQVIFGVQGPRHSRDANRR